jgi:hypothetical protein
MHFGELLPIFTWPCRENTVELDIIAELVEMVKGLKGWDIEEMK